MHKTYGNKYEVPAFLNTGMQTCVQKLAMLLIKNKKETQFKVAQLFCFQVITRDPQATITFDGYYTTL